MWRFIVLMSHVIYITIDIGGAICLYLHANIPSLTTHHSPTWHTFGTGKHHFHMSQESNPSVLSTSYMTNKISHTKQTYPGKQTCHELICLPLGPLISKETQTQTNASITCMPLDKTQGDSVWEGSGNSLFIIGSSVITVWAGNSHYNS